MRNRFATSPSRETDLRGPGTYPVLSEASAPPVMHVGALPDPFAAALKAGWRLVIPDSGSAPIRGVRREVQRTIHFGAVP